MLTGDSDFAAAMDRLRKMGEAAKGRAKPAPAAAPQAESVQSSWQIRGPKLWAELHGRAAAFAGDVDGERKWLAEFAARLGCGDCKRHWLQWVAENPPDLASAEAYRAWTVRAHNAVNRRLGKAEWLPQ
jgi:formate-dependent nitrite reductase cytochrome c552 subunit